MEHDLLKPARAIRIGDSYRFESDNRSNGGFLVCIGIVLVVSSVLGSIPALRSLGFGMPPTGIFGCGAFGAVVIFIGVGLRGTRSRLTISKDRLRYEQNASWTERLGFELPLAKCTHLAMKTQGEREEIWIGDDESRIAWAIERSICGLDVESWEELFGRLSDVCPGASERAHEEKWPTSGWTFKLKEGWTRREAWVLIGPLYDVT